MLNEALRIIRVFHDVSQKELAGRLGISPSYLSEIESGKKEASLALLKNYSAEFKIPLSSIMFFSEKMESNEKFSNVKNAISSKVLSLLNFIAERSGRDAA